MDFDLALKDALAALEAGDPRAAFTALRPALRFPDAPADSERWSRGLAALSQIGKEIAGSSFSVTTLAAAIRPDSPQALYDLGYLLYEEGLYDLAAAALDRASRLAPESGAVLSELLAALEEMGLYDTARVRLLSAPAALRGEFLFRYLLAFNTVLSGDLQGARALSRGLAGADDDERAMAARITAMLDRADAVGGVCALNDRDLRGWHYVLTGGLLLHLSPHGYQEGMSGRYAYLRDHPALCRLALDRVRLALAALGQVPERVVALPDRDSRILAGAAAAALGVPLSPFEGPGPGLFVAYDLAGAGPEVLSALRSHAPGQVLWAHAVCWTEPPPVAPDLLTLLYQFNRSPCEERPDVPAEVLIREIADAAPEPEQGPDTEQPLRALIAAALSGRQRPAAALDGGPRARMWLQGPVPSSRFKA